MTGFGGNSVFGFIFVSLLAPANTLIHKLYEKRNKNDLCVLVHNNQIGNAATRDIRKIFVIFTNLYFELNSSILRSTVGKNGFLGETLFENLRYFILSKHLSPGARKFIDLCVYAHTSFGFTYRSINAPPSHFEIESNPNLRNYYSLNDYIKDYTVLRSLSFDDLSVVFEAYFTLQLAILAVYLSSLILLSSGRVFRALIRLVSGYVSRLQAVLPFRLGLRF